MDYCVSSSVAVGNSKLHQPSIYTPKAIVIVANRDRAIQIHTIAKSLALGRCLCKFLQYDMQLFIRFESWCQSYLWRYKYWKTTKSIVTIVANVFTAHCHNWTFSTFCRRRNGNKIVFSYAKQLTNCIQKYWFSILLVSRYQQKASNLLLSIVLTMHRLSIVISK
jgi:hypothetical protein